MVNVFAKTIADDPKYRGVLPADFLHGYASAAYQVEGGASEGGRGPCLWDVALQKYPDNGEEACMSYHLWEEDIKLLQRYGARSYRFSISWSRIKPLGGKDTPINERGVEYYNHLIDGLIRAGIEPTVTLFHYDTPQALQDRYRGFAAVDPAELIEDFVEYARVCFQRFGDRVKRWLTINEPYIWAIHMFDHLENWTKADFMRSATVKGTQTDGWDAWGDLFLRFSDEELKLVQGSSDFFSINHYGTMYATGKPYTEADSIGWQTMDEVNKTWVKEGKLIGKRGENGHPHNVGWGFRKLLVHCWEEYVKKLDMPIYVYENGFPVEHEAEMPLEQIIDDKDRQQFYSDYIQGLCDAVLDHGVKIEGYHCWSLLDNLEWTCGYTPRFGVTYVDKENGFKRIPKNSAKSVQAIWNHVVRKE
ncbi:Cyanidin 3-O-glucoside 5-O-glucosyltransferase (acyl-glucose) [Scedosporium apiospermum]|uniref:Cyanidin 3-O-glucoside 5-O-glucosyltransferase (Acyl-glucose) n=1 Tax=Pseudallescheria apiosperma TaxID=563466 RepID=A0A084GGF1_PSEDA|nr:Cyanidin 3-O-glucoside 5-O-glucosyltransferase (acyl-glucose) [Scedosporium apiospermum]KEZ46413.1 Cyanidin 3-O-glucoside 5-O-glucosyltransferase (acyl-glucose) [Scedosporium apiospermum]